jgi:chitin disaccharide deacetylase
MTIGISWVRWSEIVRHPAAAVNRDASSDMGQGRQSRPIVLCADDYAIAPGVSRAILELIDAGRISATSCLTISPLWREHAAWLRQRDGHADIGLHLALTDFAPLGAMPRLARAGRLPPLSHLLALALTRRLSADEIAGEIDRQIDRFTFEFGRPPDFIDGHQHVHQLPIVRDVVAGRLKRLPPEAYVRVCDEPAAAIMRRRIAPVRALVVSQLAKGLRRRVRKLGIPANGRFAGVRDFDEKQPYRELFGRFIDDPRGPLLVMCHPGVPDEDLAAIDPVTSPREDEYRYLASDAFPADLARANVTVARFAAAAGQ